MTVDGRGRPRDERVALVNSSSYAVREDIGMECARRVLHGGAVGPHGPR